MDDFLLNPILAGIASVFGIISFVASLIVAITRFRVWLLQDPNTKWIISIPWALILIVAGIILGVNIGSENKDVFRGLSVTSSIVALGVGILLLQNSLLLYRTREAYEKLSSSYKNLLKGIERLHDTEFNLNGWTISHTIIGNGTGILKEEVTIVSVSDPVHYYFVWCRVANGSDPKEVKFSAVNLSDKTPLDYYEVAITETAIKYMIILDPPSIPGVPKRIAITCESLGVWSNLIEKGQDTYFLYVRHMTDIVKMELIAPHALRWKALYPAPQTGNSKIELAGNLSRATWEIENPPRKKYNYRLFLDGEGTRREK